MGVQSVLVNRVFEIYFQLSGILVAILNVVVVNGSVEHKLYLKIAQYFKNICPGLSVLLFFVKCYDYT